MWRILAANPIPAVDVTNLPHAQATQGRLDAIVALIFGILGSVAVLILVLGGIKYITAKGNPGDLAKARDTILYAVIGLIIVIMAYAIVAFVIRNI
jgi:phosphotransferase system  glucose/maltose/N-acetylglucosamine-specific IIC component